MSEIQIKNDELRKMLPSMPLPHRLMLTEGVRCFPSEDILLILTEIRNYNKFDESVDPYGEHDFGKFDYQDETILWKFDYYDDDFEYFKENGNRVLTVMLGHEY
jgi:hypothetical protein